MPERREYDINISYSTRTVCFNLTLLHPYRSLLSLEQTRVTESLFPPLLFSLCLSFFHTHNKHSPIMSISGSLSVCPLSVLRSCHSWVDREFMLEGVKIPRGSAYRRVQHSSTWLDDSFLIHLFIRVCVYMWPLAYMCIINMCTRVAATSRWPLLSWTPFLHVMPITWVTKIASY